jgi:hypothetical protein
LLDHSILGHYTMLKLEGTGGAAVKPSLHTLPSDGRWVRKVSAPSLEDLFTSGAPPQIEARRLFFEGGFGATYFTDARRELEWVRDDNSRAGEMVGCTASARILLIGDSHMRCASNLLAEHLCGFAVTIDKPPAPNSPVAFSGCAAVDGVLFYSMDELGEFGVPAGQWDFVFANYAQHYFSRITISMADYEREVARAASTLMSYAMEHPEVHVAWVETHPFAESTHLFQINHNDRRTYHRLQLAVAAAKHALEPYLSNSSSALGYVPIFDFVMDISDWADPTNHWSGIPELGKEISLRLLDFICNTNS